MHVGEGQALVAHLGQDEVCGAVDDAGDPLDAVGGQTLAQGLDDGDAAGHGGLEGHHDALLLGGGEDLVAVHGQQGLVGGDHVLAVFDGGQHQFLGHGVAADELDDDVDVRVLDHREGVVGDPRLAAGDRVGQIQVAVGHGGDLDGPAGAAGDFLSVAGEDGPGAATDGADAQQAYVDRFHFSNPSFRNMSRRPRMAWRVRCSFSINAKRTWSSP